MSRHRSVVSSSMASVPSSAPPLLDAAAIFPSSDVRVTSSLAGVYGFTSGTSRGTVGGSLYPFIGDRLVSSSSTTAPVASVLPSVATTDCVVRRNAPLPSGSVNRASDYARIFLYLPFPELVRSVQRLLDGSVPELVGPHLRAGATGNEFLDETFNISHRNFHFACYFYCSQLNSLYNESIMTFANNV